MTTNQALDHFIISGFSRMNDPYFSLRTSFRNRLSLDVSLASRYDTGGDFDITSYGLLT